MVEGGRRHPDIILVEVDSGEGFGFTYLSPEDFDYAADHFLLPAVKYASLDVNDLDQRRTVAYDFLARYFTKPHAKGFFRENVRWIAAASVREKFRGDAEAGSMPRVVLITRKTGDGGITIRPGTEYLEHPGYPLAVIVGKPSAGGGPAHFFADRVSYETTGKSKPNQEQWLPQIIFRLYEYTPSVVMGMPKEVKGGDMAVECRALAFGCDSKLVERAPE
ncbi:MAG: hypothetical protein CMG46_12380 [Candidatus Marinimicrobia bacterium]|nr:hypothetical protein [Candidatus Neomarinimicrobiota bacterium]